MFAVLSLQKKVIFNTVYGEQVVDLVLAEGMIGAIPVFATVEHAEAFANDECQIILVEFKRDPPKDNTNG